MYLVFFNVADSNQRMVLDVLRPFTSGLPIARKAPVRFMFHAVDLPGTFYRVFVLSAAS